MYVHAAYLTENHLWEQLNTRKRSCVLPPSVADSFTLLRMLCVRLTSVSVVNHDLYLLLIKLSFILVLLTSK